MDPRDGVRKRLGREPLGAREEVTHDRLTADSKTSRGGVAKILEMHAIVRRHSRRWLPPSIVVHASGMLYGALWRRLGYIPDTERRRPLARFGWAARWLDRVLERGQLALGLAGAPRSPAPGVRPAGRGRAPRRRGEIGARGSAATTPP
jgi:hypothetical protein